MSIFLAKAKPPQPIDFCQCKNALAGTSSQLECPWCGCGYLFTCLECRLAFTFATAVDVPNSYSELAERDLRECLGLDDGEVVKEMAVELQQTMSGLVVGRNYVYLDGTYLEAAPGPVAFTGWHARHSLASLPHLDELKKPGELKRVLGDDKYWTARKIH